ncbi:MAG: hypothetical protein RLZZ292_3663 [Bacteroidota bacterium]|jgi:uncharacterized protein (DUF2141 family)
MIGKLTTTLLSLFLLLFCLGFTIKKNPTASAYNGTLTVELSNIDTPSGRVRVGIYDKNNFLTPNYLTARSVAVNSYNKVSVTFVNLPFGEYSIAVYHDINDNRSLDKNGIGIPSEPYAFSNNIKVRFRAPTYNETKFNFYNNEKLDLTLQRWW